MFSRGAAARRRTALAATVLTTAGTALVALPAAPAEADITTLCSGYTSCAAKGMGNAGYAAVSGHMYWRMYGGHNCTNYAAYRMIKAGMSTTRPWTGGGNATNWGTKMARITNGTPRVGAVAWWKAGTRPAGSSGHVAYVEKVVSANEVVVSMDSWSGDFSWATITRSGGGWPSGFVHFKDVALRAIAGAGISGFAKVGSVLRAKAPTWKPAASSLAYQWYAGGTAIAKATGSTYVPTNDTLGKTITVRVVGSRYGYAPAATASTATAAVLPGTLRATSAPTLRGTPKLGQVLTATPGAWKPKPDSVTYRWLSGGRAIAGANKQSYRATPASVGRSIAVQVIANRRGYDPVVKTLSFRTVAPGVMPKVATPTLVGQPKIGGVLRVRLPRVPKGARTTVQWVHSSDGRVVRSGSTSYRVTPADLGSRIVAKVTVTRLGYRTQMVHTRPTNLVRTRTAMRVVAARSTRGLATYVSVRAAGLSHVDGLVRVTSHGRLLGKIKVHDGVGRATIRHLPHGRSTVRFTLVNTRRTFSTSVVKHVRR